MPAWPLTRSGTWRKVGGTNLPICFHLMLPLTSICAQATISVFFSQGRFLYILYVECWESNMIKKCLYINHTDVILWSMKSWSYINRCILSLNVNVLVRQHWTSVTNNQSFSKMKKKNRYILNRKCSSCTSIKFGTLVSMIGPVFLQYLFTSGN